MRGIKPYVKFQLKIEQALAGLNDLKKAGKFLTESFEKLLP